MCSFCCCFCAVVDVCSSLFIPSLMLLCVWYLFPTANLNTPVFVLNQFCLAFIILINGFSVFSPGRFTLQKPNSNSTNFHLVISRGTRVCRSLCQVACNMCDVGHNEAKHLCDTDTARGELLKITSHYVISDMSTFDSDPQQLVVAAHICKSSYDNTMSA